MDDATDHGADRAIFRLLSSLGKTYGLDLKTPGSRFQASAHETRNATTNAGQISAGRVSPRFARQPTQTAMTMPLAG